MPHHGSWGHWLLYFTGPSIRCAILFDCVWVYISIFVQKAWFHFCALLCVRIRSVGQLFLPHIFYYLIGKLLLVWWVLNIGLFILNKPVDPMTFYKGLYVARPSRPENLLLEPYTLLWTNRVGGRCSICIELALHRTNGFPIPYVNVSFCIKLDPGVNYLRIKCDLVALNMIHSLPPEYECYLLKVIPHPHMNGYQGKVAIWWDHTVNFNVAICVFNLRIIITSGVYNFNIAP